MPGRIEKTVFISYRRTNFWTALAVFQNLHSRSYDVFFDYKSIPSGDFEQVITENVKSRAHFIVILSPTALERCNEPGDWLRREIETAIDNKRNIIPLIMEGFGFNNPATLKALTGKLANLKKYNALSIPVEYFEEAMAKLCGDRFLNRPLEAVLHPVSVETKQIIEEQLAAATNAEPVEVNQLTAQEWLERGYVFAVQAKNFDEAIRCFSKAISLDPNFSDAYYNRGQAYRKKGVLDTAIRDFDDAIRFNSDNADYYLVRGLTLGQKKEVDRAIQDFDQAIYLKPNDAKVYNNRGYARRIKGDLIDSIKDFDAAIRIKPDFARAYGNRARVYLQRGDFLKSIEDFWKAISLRQK